MKLTLLAFLTLVCGLHAESPREDAADAAHALATDTIPVFRLEKATFEESFTLIKSAWHKEHPDASFPVAITDFQPPSGYRDENPARISLELKEVPYMMALKYIAELSGRTATNGDGIFQLVGLSWIEEDWSTRIHEISPDALKGLALTASSLPSEVRAAFQQYGVEFEDWMKVGLTRDGNGLVVTAYQSQQETIAGMIHLLNAGFTINKADQQ